MSQGRRSTKFMLLPFSPKSGAGEKPAEGGILLRFETFGEIKLALEEIFSPSAAAVILYESARKCGMRSCERIMKKTRMKEEVLRRLYKLKKKENWGKISFRNIDFKKASGRVLIADSFEAVAHKSKQSICHFFRGFLAGFLSRLFEGKSITVIEEKCAARGDKNCEFRFASSIALYAEQAKQIMEDMIREAALKHSSEAI